ncbi:sugar phosphate isomerase/epimerase [Asticcacaulis sp.]|uniref:sugar phosphate isomerase/epimerase family protein n=1 Tax=Asticcacaulis sp. TaxID=1872648 RepID=UPI002607BF26|nr:sugar phosphate isomerase/epimerase family protein [Asticcacaulis sp.]
MLADYNVAGVEVAPSRLAAWDCLTAERLDEYRFKCNSSGLEICSLQAILFNQPQAQLLAGDHGFQALCQQMERIGSVAQALGAKIAVFGAPGNRKRGDLSLEAATALGLSRMRLLGDIAESHGYIIGIEPVPTYYNCDFLDRIDELSNFVAECNHPFIATHFDIACITLGGDNPVEKLNEAPFVHFHASEPNLGSFEAPICDHPAVARRLRQSGYDGWVVIEMRQVGDDLKALEEALKYVSKTYGFAPNELPN